MRAADLDLRELLDLTAGPGTIRFAGQRALVMDAVALGLLRAELVRALGAATARGILTRFGFGHGWRTAETMKTAFPWDTEGDWRRAGGRLHTLQGLVAFEPIPRAPGEPAPFAESIWRDSYEAEQHVLHIGKADEPVCWTLCGFASGYLTRAAGEEIFCIEEACRGRGDPVCRMVGKRRAEWGAAADAFLPYYESDCVSGVLADVARKVRLAERRLERRHAELVKVAGTSAEPAGLVARSPAMARLVALAERVARTESTALIVGESGVGKERLARVIHDASPRAAGPLVAINCAALPATLLESELFGHARGAFTGASQERPGLFESASGGTLFLDEIGEIPLDMQAKLLRALQEREVRRVGENRVRPIDVRLIAATNRDLGEAVAAKLFREDLYYRIRVVELRVPPLRERREDIMTLARLFVAQAAKRSKCPVKGLTPRAADQLLRHPWPGNVRELENAIERAVVLAEGDRVDVEDLPEEIRDARGVVAPSPSTTGTLADVERLAGRLPVGASATHTVAAGRKAWVQVARGAVKVGAHTLGQGDGAAVDDEGPITIVAREADASGVAEVLVFDLP